MRDKTTTSRCRTVRHHLLSRRGTPSISPSFEVARSDGTLWRYLQKRHRHRLSICPPGAGHRCDDPNELDVPVPIPHVDLIYTIFGCLFQCILCSLGKNIKLSFCRLWTTYYMYRNIYHQSFIPLLYASGTWSGTSTVIFPCLLPTLYSTHSG